MVTGLSVVRWKPEKRDPSATENTAAAVEAAVEAAMMAAVTEGMSPSGREGARRRRRETGAMYNMAIADGAM
jgi:hypothetical protein